MDLMIKKRNNHYNNNKEIAVINPKHCNAFIAIRVSAITPTITAILKYTKQEIELTTHRKHVAPNQESGPNSLIKVAIYSQTYRSNRKITFINLINTVMLHNSIPYIADPQLTVSEPFLYKCIQ